MPKVRAAKTYRRVEELPSVEVFKSKLAIEMAYI